MPSLQGTPASSRGSTSILTSLTAIVEFHVITTLDGPLSHRTVTLSAPSWQAPIGRSTSSYPGPQESPENALFSSRVISRSHALIAADPATREVTIQDVESMHGTHIGDKRLAPFEPETIDDGVEVTFGATVERAEGITHPSSSAGKLTIGTEGSTQKFKPIKTRVYSSWSDGLDSNMGAARTIHVSRNSFSADYSDEEPITPYDSLDEATPRSPNLADPPRTFAPPSSDISDDVISIESDEPANEHESPNSSPLGSIDLVEKKTTSDKAETRTRTQLSPISIEDSDEDSYYEDSSLFDGDDDEDELGHLDAVQDTAPPEYKHTFTIELPAVPNPVRTMRDPSPSDAAMVKPHAERSPPWHRLPSINELPNAYAPESPISSFAENTRNESAWAGHNSVLYDPTPFASYGSYAIPPPQPYPFDLPDAPEPPAAPVAPYYYSHPYYMTAAPRAEDTADEIPKVVKEHIPESSHQETTEPAAPIESILNNAADLEVFYTNFDDAVADTRYEIKESRKRKAAEISDCSDGEEDHPIVEAGSRPPSPVTGSPNFPDTRLIASPPTAPFEIYAPTIQAKETVERPAKKAKKSMADKGARQVRQGTSFKKLAATAMTGVVFGAMGMLIGLNSLPEGFFE